MFSVTGAWQFLQFGDFCFVCSGWRKKCFLLVLQVGSWSNSITAVIQQPLCRFTVCHKMGLGKQQYLEEKEPTQKITAGEQYQKEQRKIILTWLLRSRLDDLIGGFQCSSFPMELQGSAAWIQPPQLNKCLCLVWWCKTSTCGLNHPKCSCMHICSLFTLT